MFIYSVNIIFSLTLGYRFRGSDHDKDNFHHLFHDISCLMGEFNVEDYIPYMGWMIDRVNDHHKKLERVFHELDIIF